MEESLPWYRALSADDRSWVGLVAQAGIAAFVAWFRDPAALPQVTADVFGTAPRELTRSVTLRQTLDMVRAVVEVVEERVDELAAPGDEVALREAVLRYSREIAFAAAEVYASAAEARGAWDARLESLVVDAVLRGDADDALSSRAAALGWGTVSGVCVVAGRVPRGGAAGGHPLDEEHPGPHEHDAPGDVGSPGGGPGLSADDESVERAVDALRRAAERLDLEALAAVQGSRLVAVLGNVEDTQAAASGLLETFGPGPVVVGPLVPHLFAAGRSARSALAGLLAARAWPDAPRPVLADDLLPERVLAGDATARRALVDRVHRPLAAAGSSVLETVTTYLELGGAIEGTARLLFVHPNTVRYRLRRAVELTGYDVTSPRDAHVVRVALALGRLAEPSARPRRPL